MSTFCPPRTVALGTTELLADVGGRGGGGGAVAHSQGCHRSSSRLYLRCAWPGWRPVRLPVVSPFSSLPPMRLTFVVYVWFPLWFCFSRTYRHVQILCVELVWLSSSPSSSFSMAGNHDLFRAMQLPSPESPLRAPALLSASDISTSLSPPPPPLSLQPRPPPPLPSVLPSPPPLVPPPKNGRLLPTTWWAGAAPCRPLDVLRLACLASLPFPLSSPGDTAVRGLFYPTEVGAAGSGARTCVLA